MYLISLEREKRQRHKTISLKSLLHPSCFPNILSMAVLAQYEVIWEVNDNFQKQTYRNRYHICTDQGLHKLSIPIKHVGGKDGRQKYAEVRIENSYRWQILHWRTLQTAYRTSPFFEYYEDDLAPLFQKEFKFLLDFNWESLNFLANALQIIYPQEHTVEYKKDFDQGNDMRLLVNAKKKVSFGLPTYKQVFSDRHGFVANTSALDLIFNEGPNAVAYLKNLAFN